jgi:hypothetical protein
MIALFHLPWRQRRQVPSKGRVYNKPTRRHIPEDGILLDNIVIAMPRHRILLVNIVIAMPRHRILLVNIVIAMPKHRITYAAAGVVVKFHAPAALLLRICFLYSVWT